MSAPRGPREAPDESNVVALVIDQAEEVVARPESAAASPATQPWRNREAAPPAGGPVADQRIPQGPPGARHGQIEMGDGGHLPIVPLGVHGDAFHYLDANRQLRTLTSRDHQRLGLLGLFGTQTSLLYRYFPRTDRKGETTGWRPEEVAELLMRECSARGIWNGAERERGPGAWTDREGGLVLHCGDAILYGGQWQPPGAIYGRHVYPAAPSMPRPSEEIAATGAGGPAETLLDILRTWQWKRPSTDPEILLGWICAGMIGGALDWRPMCWITGGAGTGKTTLQKLLGLVFDGALVAVTDSSEAGIRQKLGKASLPVALDEQEAEEDNRKQLAVIKLARQAASGGVVLRGGASHQGAEFQARSCFLFSSILVPPLSPQDRSRMAILELEPLAGVNPPALEPARLAVIGAALRRRLIDQWPRMAGTVQAYRLALASQGHSSRGADQFGTILASLDLAIADAPPDSDTLDEWADRLRPSDEEASEESTDQYACIYRLLTSPVDVYRGGKKKTVGEWVGQAVGKSENQDSAEAAEALAVLGLRMAREDGRWWLAIANKHQGLEALFHGSKWAGTSGTMGVWVQSLRRLPEAKPVKARFAGLQLRATAVPLDYVMPDEPAPQGPVGPRDDLTGGTDAPAP